MPEALKCPSCSAPLDYPPAGATSMRCPYCNCTVVIPGATTSTSQAQNVQVEDLSAALGPMVGKALDMAKVAQLLRDGKKIEAIKVYRQTYSVGLESAKTAVENIAAGKPPDHGAGPGPHYTPLAPVNPGANFFRLGCGLAFSILLIGGIILTSVMRSLHHSFSSSTPVQPQPVTPDISEPTVPTTPPPPPSYADMVLEFGNEGIGAGQFKDSRSVAVDGNGNIYVGEYSDGRVQVFDSQGKFVSAWGIKKQSMMNLLADRRGNVYVVTPGEITKYDGATGMPQTQLDNSFNDNPEDYMDACLALNGDIYALAGNADIVDIGSDGHIKSDVNESEKVGEDVSFERIAVAGTGEIYAVDRTKGVFKFAADGRYINRFGGGGEDIAAPRPGHLMSPNGIAIDGQGRVFVTDDGPPVQVFDSDGTYIDSFGGNEVAFGIAIDDKNAIYACFRNKYTVRKYEVAKH